MLSLKNKKIMERHSAMLQLVGIPVKGKSKLQEKEKKEKKTLRKGPSTCRKVSLKFANRDWDKPQALPYAYNCNALEMATCAVVLQTSAPQVPPPPPPLALFPEPSLSISPLSRGRFCPLPGTNCRAVAFNPPRAEPGLPPIGACGRLAV